MYAQSSTLAPVPISPGAESYASRPAGLLARHPLVSYFAIAFAGTWLFVLPLVLSTSNLGVLPITLPMAPFVVAGPFFGPTLAAFLLTGLTAGPSGVKQLLRRYVLWRVGIQWYLVMLFGSLAVLTIAATVFFGTAPLQALAQKWPLVLSAYLPSVLLGSVLVVGEEGGWRGFALPSLQARYGPVAGSLVLGALWGVWHLPGFFGGWLGAFSIPAFLGVILGGMAFSLIITWVFNNTRGSILMAMLMHSASNAASAVGVLLLPATMPAWVHLMVYSSGIPVLAYGVVAVALVLVTRGRLSYRPAAE
jgi:uncharacterized protein